MTCPDDTALASFVDGTLAATERGSIETHIDTCRTCRQTVSEAARGQPRAAPERVGRYQLLAPLGAGAMGVVYTAHDPELDRRVAVKLVASGSPQRQERLAREARALAKISHPNVVPVFDVGTAGDRVFIAMELVDGDTLRHHRGDTRALLAQAAAGLAAAHAAGVVHRDFKPDNVLVGRDGRVRVSDFGLALEERGELGDGPIEVTRTGSLLGTPAYMAPEQLRGERADAASDQFAFCVTAWELLTGARPFAGTDVAGLLAAIEQGPPPAKLDRALAAALTRGLAVDPAQRHRDLAPVIRALGHRRSKAWLAVLAVPALVGGALLMRGGDEDPCLRAERGLDTVWNDAVRDELAASFAKAPLGGEHVAAAAAAIESWSAAWRSTSGQTCRAHRDGVRSDSLFDRQQACLAARRDELSAVLALAKDVPASRLPKLASELGSLDACTSATLPTPPRDTTALTVAKAQHHAGKFADAIRTIEAQPATTDEALAGELALLLGESLRAAGKLAPARDAFSAAAAHAERAKDDALKARAWTEQLALVGDEVVELAEAARIEPLARAAIERAEGGPELRAGLAAAIGRIRLRAGKFPEAIAAFDEAIVQHKRRTPVDRFELASVTNSLAGAHGELGDHATMLRLLDEARELLIATVGKHHPDVAATWTNRVQPLHFLGRDDEAMQAARTAIEIYERSVGDSGTDLWLAQAIENLAVLHAMRGQHAEAVAQFERSRAMTERVLGPNHAELGQAWFNLATAQRELGKLDEAARGYRKALAIWEATLGADHIDNARVLIGLAKIELEQKHFAAALPLADRAIAIRTKATGNPKHLGHAHYIAAQASLGTGAKPAACQHVTAALAIYSKDESEELAEIRDWLTSSKLVCR